MPRKYKTTERFLKPDPRYGSKLATKFINNLMLDGKKQVAQGLFYNSMDKIATRISEDEPFEVFKLAIENVKPRVEVRSKRVGGATYQIPIEVNRKRQLTLAFRWIIGAARERSGRSMVDRLTEELLSAYRNEGTAVTKKINVHKMAEANKAFAHFAW